MGELAGESFWIDSTGTTAYPSADDGATVDVAVIGGGITGLSTAWELVRAGRSVAVLEADRIATGITGYTSAKLTALHSLKYADLASTAGAQTARLYAQAQQDAIDHVEHTAAGLGIDCEFERVPAYTYVECEARMLSALRKEVQAATHAGLRATFETECGLPFPIRGAVRVADQAQFHPRRYLLGLAAAIVDGGGTIYERSRVVGLDEGEPCRVRTENGSVVTADAVIAATGYPIFDRALLFPRLTTTRELVVAAAIGEDDDPHGTFVTPESTMRSVRTSPYDDGRRLLVVTGEQFVPGAGGVGDRFDRLERWTRERFDGAEILYRWAAQDASASDGIPFVGPLRPGARNTFVATGFGGWGLTNGVMSGRLIAGLITGDHVPWTSIFDPGRLHPMTEARSLAKLQTRVARHFIGDRLCSSSAGSPDDLAPGSGAVLRVHGDRCAVYRDDAGDIHAVSATCTHLGCLVAFNDAERTWECPCHGSRFDIDGDVLEGPATRPLEPRDL